MTTMLGRREECQVRPLSVLCWFVDESRVAVQCVCSFSLLSLLRVVGRGDAVNGKCQVVSRLSQTQPNRVSRPTAAQSSPLHRSRDTASRWIALAMRETHRHGDVHCGGVRLTHSGLQSSGVAARCHLQ